jgi:putative ABC transport system permease protein
LLSFALKSLWARKLRALGTALAVFIGVSLVAGTYVLTDTINAAFEDIFNESLKNTAVVITHRQPVRQQSGEAPTLPARLLKRVRSVAGVRLAAGAIFTPGGIFNGTHAVGSQFAPKFISSELPPGLESLTYVAGRRPANGTEVSLDKAAADDAGLKLGDEVRVAGERRARTYRLVGLTELGGASFGGASIAQLTLPQAQLVTDMRGRFNQISVASEPGVTADVLRARIERVVPPSVRVETGTQNANRQSRQIRSDLSFLPTFLLVFAGIALVVGAFVIFNTFSITVAQRIREFGMLRTIGASRRQILRAVLGEALLVGILASGLGLAGGLGFATAIEAIFRAVGVGLPTTSPVFQTRTIVVALLIGVVVTLVASMVPAIRSTQVPPMAALREVEPLPGRRRSAIYAAISAILCAGGLGLLLIGLFANVRDSGQAAALTGGGAAAVLLAVSLFSPRLVRPLASAIGAPLERMRGLVGRLARENAQRKPARTAATAAAVMIGLALVVFVTIFAAGLNKSIANAIDSNFQGQLEIQNTDGFSPIPAAAASAVRRVPGVGLVSTLRIAEVKVDGVSGTQQVGGLDPKTATRVLSLDYQDGASANTLRDLSDEGAIVSQSFADSNDLGVGDRLTVLSQTGKRPSYRIVGAVKDNANLLGSFVVTQAAMARQLGITEDTYDFVRLAPGAGAAAVKARIKPLLRRGFPTAEVLNQTQLKQQQEGSVNGLLNLVYGLLSLAVVVSLFGIANTLALSIHERTRELGIVRAVGMSRRQVRRMIRYEAVITALIGAILGLVLGAAFAALVTQPLADQGFILAYPVGTLLLIVIAAALAGVLVAIGPARRASRLDVLDALAYE